MINLLNFKPRKREKITPIKVDSSYNKKFMTARLNLELIQQEEKFSTPTKELIDTQI